MSSEPRKKKPKRTDIDETDEAQHLEALHLSNVNEVDLTLNAVNLEFSKKNYLGTSDSELDKSISESEHNDSDNTSFPSTQTENVSIPPAPNISSYQSIVSIQQASSSERSETNITVQDSTLSEFQQSLIKQCLCGVNETVLCDLFVGQRSSSGAISIVDWPETRLLQFLSNLQLLFDVFLKQNNKGFICSKIVANCDMILFNQYNLIEQIISLSETRNGFVHYLSARVLSSFLIIAKTDINNEWLETILGFLTTENLNYLNFNFALEIIKRVVEWKDIEIHVLEEPDAQDAIRNVDCVTKSFHDSESFDTSSIKGLIIKSLESKWPELISKIQSLIVNNSSIDNQMCILTFLALWERIISVKANLSVIDIKPFYAHLEYFVQILNNNISSLVYKQLLSLFNEVLCYGSTLALQDMVPDDTCQLAHLVVRYVKDYRLLDSLPYRREPGSTVNSFVGTIPSTEPSQSNVDKTLLQKMVLLVLKSIAVTIKETRSDSSDSSVGSDDYDFYQDMQLIERSIRDVLKKLDAYLKSCLDFHPETPFCKMMVHLFNDQDNYLMESMVCTLDIAVGVSYRNAVFQDLAVMLNPVHSFIEFLKIVNHESDVLLDYLVDSETCFLLYLLRFLKFIRRNWAKFVRSCSEGNTRRNNELDDTMTVLIRLKMQINRLVSRDLFPYNISPILRLLTVCENLYDGQDEFS
ncbi:hypothetical protein ABEB36_001022 [Hypothenemus hampei]|uniref:Protein lines n=1 Tax=Hypothenemus hampei TaxID=57062 RepID=A0ABD1FD70_HYPHA